MNDSWDTFIYVFTHPYFWVFLVFAMSLEYILKFLRRFYPKSLQKYITDNEEFANELQEDAEDRELVGKVRNLEGIIIFIPALVLMLIYLLFSYFNSVKFTPHFIFHSAFFVFASAMFISVGIYILKGADILSYILKDNYQRYLEINKKISSLDPIIKFFEKYQKFFGYLFILFGLLYIIMVVFKEWFE